MIAGMSAMVVTKMELQRLKEKLPNISIRYTGTWKDLKMIFREMMQR